MSTTVVTAPYFTPIPLRLEVRVFNALDLTLQTHSYCMRLLPQKCLGTLAYQKVPSYFEEEFQAKDTFFRVLLRNNSHV